MASKKTIDQCLAEFQGCMTKSTPSSAAPAARAAIVASGGKTSGYAMEGSPFGGAIGGRNWKLILTLFVLVIMLWILAKKM